MLHVGEREEEEEEEEEEGVTRTLQYGRNLSFES
jgi:hypothetical protein